MSEEPKTETPIKMWMPDGTIETYYRTATEQLKIAIIGPPKGGKSRLAATAPKKPIFFFDFDGRLASVSGIAGVFGKTYLDDTNPSKSAAWQMLEQDMGQFEYHKIKKEPVPGTFVFDSITYLCDRAMRRYVTDNASNSKEVKSVTVANRTYYTPKSYAAYTAEMNMIGNMIARGVELGSDVIAIFHERPEEAPESTSEEKKFTGKVSVHPPRAEMLLPLFNEFWRVKPTYDGKEYQVYTKPSIDFIGATCLNIDSLETADITKMLEKHKLNTKENK